MCFEGHYHISTDGKGKKGSGLYTSVLGKPTSCLGLSSDQPKPANENVFFIIS